MGKSIFKAYNDTKNILEAVSDDYVFESKQIIKRVTGYTSKEILMNYAEELSPEQENKIAEIIEKRKTHYPLQYILGEWDFYGFTFKVGEGALVPRADTETLVDKALEKIKDIKAPTVLDLCTGTGCIAISIAKNRTDAAVTAVEKYEEAKKYADQNRENLEVNNLRILKGDVLEGAAQDMKYDLIVSNPPYISAKEMGELQKEVTFEPASALFGGEDGLIYYRAICENYLKSLKDNGILMFEIGESEAEAVRQIMEKSGFENIDVATDIEGRQRVIFGTKG